MICNKFAGTYRVQKGTLALGLQLYKKDTPTQMFSCEIFEMFKHTYFEKHLQTRVKVS